MRRMAVVVAVLLLASGSVWAAESAGMKQFLAGGAAPFTLKLKDLDGSYLRFSSPYSGGSGWLAGMSRYGGDAAPAYTQGRTVRIGVEDYLIAYAVEAKGGDSNSFMYGRSNPNAPAPEPVTAESTLSLTLLGQRGYSVMGKVRPFNLATELADYKQLLANYQEMVATRAEMERGPVAVDQTDNLTKLQAALDMYTGDNDGTLPPMDTAEAFQKALDEYVESPDAFIDPGTNEPYGLNASLSGKKLAEIKNPAQTILLYQTKPGRDGARGAIFASFTVSRLTEADWTKLKADSNIP